jgi:hypothetical protein
MDVAHNRPRFVNNIAQSKHGPARQAIVLENRPNAERPISAQEMQERESGDADRVTQAQSFRTTLITAPPVLSDESSKKKKSDRQKYGERNVARLNCSIYAETNSAEHGQGGIGQRDRGDRNPGKSAANKLSIFSPTPQVNESSAQERQEESAHHFSHDTMIEHCAAGERMAEVGGDELEKKPRLLQSFQVAWMPVCCLVALKIKDDAADRHRDPDQPRDSLAAGVLFLAAEPQERGRDYPGGKAAGY